MGTNRSKRNHRKQRGALNSTYAQSIWNQQIPEGPSYKAFQLIQQVTDLGQPVLQKYNRQVKGPNGRAAAQLDRPWGSTQTVPSKHSRVKHPCASRVTGIETWGIAHVPTVVPREGMTRPSCENGFTTNYGMNGPQESIGKDFEVGKPNVTSTIETTEHLQHSKKHNTTQCLPNVWPTRFTTEGMSKLQLKDAEARQGIRSATLRHQRRDGSCIYQATFITWITNQPPAPGGHEHSWSHSAKCKASLVEHEGSDSHNATKYNNQYKTWLNMGSQSSSVTKTYKLA